MIQKLRYNILKVIISLSISLCGLVSGKKAGTPNPRPPKRQVKRKITPTPILITSNAGDAV